MNPETARTLVQHVAAEWRSLRADDVARRRDYSARQMFPLARDLWDPREDERWPWGAWIALLDALEDGVDEAHTPVQRTWFVNEDGLREMSPWSLLRFWTVQIERRWSRADAVPPPDAAFARPR